ncbi:response regulator receiver domain-containing protein [Caballeronia calidae]|uniref:Response regulator receiver domain-containing protein n=1 Tax=Caballeronia calidae TaxID=1777139 RepID=A0A158EKS4_9BURK|nr:response regulator [Caballeronia calidae]SAL06986.1 response regulator receiver domain-containing protein [Caballeronia calidae]
MKKLEIAPFLFPTTVVFVDDSARFLANLALQLDEKLAFRLFDSPKHALEAINQQSGLHTRAQFFARHEAEDPGAHELIKMSVESIGQQIHDTQRFARISTVVVDYDMPGMNGLEFCRNIQNPNIKKIVLTGVADEQVAVKSFNEGLIDCFLQKQSPEVVQVLTQTLKNLQHAYFERQWQALADTLEVTDFKFLRDARLAQVIQQIFTAREIIEHYICARPDGLMMLNSRGKAARLIVYTEQTLQALREIARDQDAPPEFIAAIDQGHTLPFFPSADGNYQPRFEPWQAYMHPAQVVHGDTTYTYAVVDHIEYDVPLPFDHYLDYLDQQP